MKMTTIRAKEVTEHRGFFISEGAEVYIDGEQGLPGDFVVVADDGAFKSIIPKVQVDKMFSVLQPRGRKPKEAPAFASPEQPPKQVTVEEHLRASNG